jgi:hypothetical protein
MHALVGVFLKDEAEEVLDKSTVLYPYSIIAANKTRTYYAVSKVH